jgi:hypothetical protein
MSTHITLDNPTTTREPILQRLSIKRATNEIPKTQKSSAVEKGKPAPGEPKFLIQIRKKQQAELFSKKRKAGAC